MTTTTVRPDELTAAELAGWRQMQLRDDSLTSPFLSPEFALAVGRRRPAARVAVLCDGSGPAAYFPFERRALGIGKPIGAGFCDCQGLVHRRGLDWDPVSLLADCGLRVWEFDHLVAGQTAFEANGVHRAASPVIDVGDGYQAYAARLGGHSAKLLHRVRGKGARLERETGPLRFVFDERDPAMLRTLAAWKTAQCLAKGRRDVFAQPGLLSVVRELADSRAEGCAGVLSVLYAGGRPVSMLYSLRARHLLSSWLPVYDAALARHSPGLLLYLHLLEAAAGLGLRRIDLGKGHDRYKESLKTGDVMVAQGRVERGTALPALRRWQVASLDRTKAVVSANPGLRRLALGAVGLVERRTAH
ncbi:GNAT family N-acetyltransferase [Kitasatospora sp. NBC_00315]|uniref:GNAT family N-acetyltransferase n=1 Tax=Kitasatospora sp. NBC_00315 TaxID=2975963 RepID=UPI0032458608